jgi:hypothetical protein
MIRTARTIKLPLGLVVNHLLRSRAFIENYRTNTKSRFVCRSMGSKDPGASVSDGTENET